MSGDFLIMFKHSYTIVPIIMIISVLFIFIDSMITGKEVETSSYLKTAMVAGLLSMLIVHINTIKGFVQEEIITTPPPF